jgi:hypothetical protein
MKQVLLDHPISVPPPPLFSLPIQPIRSEYYGHAQRRFPAELELPMIDADKTFAIRITHENALPKDTQEVCIQCALLYTTAEGQRRIRMHTMSGTRAGGRRYPK